MSSDPYHTASSSSRPLKSKSTSEYNVVGASSLFDLKAELEKGKEQFKQQAAEGASYVRGVQREGKVRISLSLLGVNVKVVGGKGDEEERWREGGRVSSSSTTTFVGCPWAYPRIPETRSDHNLDLSSSGARLSLEKRAHQQLNVLPSSPPPLLTAPSPPPSSHPSIAGVPFSLSPLPETYEMGRPLQRSLLSHSTSRRC